MKSLSPKVPKASARNPFPEGSPLRAQFDTMLKAYADKHPDIIHADGRRCFGNTLSGAFWKGYDMIPPFNVVKGTWAWACYRAGQTPRLTEDELKKRVCQAAVAINEFGDILPSTVKTDKERVEKYMMLNYGALWTSIKEKGGRIANCQIIISEDK